MTTKFSIGDEVLIKATVEEINVYECNGKEVRRYKLAMDNSVRADVCGRAVAEENCLLSANNEQNGLLD